MDWNEATISSRQTSAKRNVGRRFLAVLIKYRYRYLLIAPGLLYVLLFRYGPMYGIIVAFQNYNGFKGISGSEWVGFKWFLTFFNGPDFWHLMRNTLVISLMKISFGMAPDIVMAVLLNEARSRWFKRSVQTLTYMPHFLSWIIIYGIVLAFLSTSSGLVNHWLKDSGFNPVPFLTSNEWFRWILVFTDIWKDLGWGAIIYLAAIAAIDPQLYEAAVMDGANKARQMWHITLPGIRNIFILMLTLRLGNVLDAGFTQIFAMYNPLVYDSVDIIDTWVYRAGIIENRVGLATAVGLFKSVIGLILVISANRVAKKFDSQIW
ncbi:ABC transporter permease [Paenibacillus contaminans]|uniref:Sugar ABC transporter permease n=1 Tax=Paenibacillus contaminans TaxID=450362 RepID=A0A329LYP4_9BACL|nr:ABC transporter permease subunit [Paenibacillus contaminans]RAV12959.1 sugar ABC transporter permease [Paenibacillus contaminans]